MSRQPPDLSGLQYEPQNADQADLSQEQKRWLIALYALQALSLLSLFTLLCAFLVASYYLRDKFSTPIARSHLRWQSYTAAITLALLLVGYLTKPILIGYLVWPVAAIWCIYRIARGWLRLLENRPMHWD